MQIPERDSSLAKACAAGERMAQQQLYTQFCDDMLILCLRYLPAREEAQEALMDGFLACFKSIGGFTDRGAGSLRAWLKQIMMNQCLARLRKRGGLRSEELRDDHAAPGIDAAALDNLSAKEIMQLVQQLPDGYRTVFNLYCFEGLAHKDIATMLGISEATSKSQLSKAKAKLRERLQTH